MTRWERSVSSVAAQLSASGSGTEPPRWARGLIVLAGLLLCQAVLLGSSLWGHKVLLPLDILSGGATYLPRRSAMAPPPEPKDGLRSDLVYQAEMWRRFAVEEVRAGRLPLWNPYNDWGSAITKLIGLEYVFAQ